MKSKGVRIYDLARRLAVPSRDLLDMLKKRGVEASSHMNTIDGATADMLLEAFGAKKPSPPSKSEQAKSDRKPGVRRHTPSEKTRKPSGPRQPTERRPRRQPRQQPQAGPRQEKPEKPVRQGKRERRFPPRKPGEQPQGRDEGRRRDTSKRREGFVRRDSQGRPYPRQEGQRRDDRKGETGITQRPGEKTPGKRYDRPAEGVRRKPVRRGDVARQKPSGQPQVKRPPKDQRSVQKPALRKPAPRKPAPRKPAPRKPAPRKAVPPKPAPPPKPVVEELPKRVKVPEVIAVKELADQMNVPPAKVVHHLMTMGIMANVNQMLEPEAAKSIAENFGFEVEETTIDETLTPQEEVVDESKLRPRPPVVTIMGHVDHGKTTLLDAIRESKIADSEFGGITQHIGAYVVEVGGQEVVFLDTPGHEAFTSMRARGAQVTDEVVLVVAADDGIMPQTIEAIDHARAAEVPIVVAINKIDLPGANPDRVMQELTKHGLTPEDWGGDTICVQVSAKQRINLDDLLEMIVLQAEILELKANPDCPAKGVVVEAMLDKGRGPVATVLVQNGTLRIGDAFVAGLHHGKVRAMFDDRGRKATDVGPATPVEVLGLTGVPVAGDAFTVVENERTARHISETRQEQQQKTEFLKTGKITLEELHHHIKEGGFQELRIVIKADVHGSVEALSDALERLSTEQVRLLVIHGGVGAINESDVMLAAADTNVIILGFNVRPVAKAREMAEKEQIDMRLYTVIYQAIDDIKKAMEGLLEPTYKEVLLGEAVVQATFAVPKVGTVAGCRVTSGKIVRNSLVKLFRDHKEIYKGNIDSLRRVKDDVKEVLTGYECGIKLENYNDIKVDDIIEAYTLEKITMTLEEAAKRK